MVMICGGTGCIAQGSKEVYAAFEKAIAEQGLQDRVRLKMTGCHGFCEKGPVMVILPSQMFYPGVKPKDVPEILAKSVIDGEPIERLQYVDPVSGDKCTYEYDIPFYAKQQRDVFRLNGRIDAVDLDDYVSRDGYSALVKALEEYAPEKIVEMVTQAGLRGRGGAGFPTGVKWRISRGFQAEQKFLICNADEGDPGAFMDRSLLEGTPHAIIEGMLIAGFAIGATRGIIYVRAEYPLAVKNTRAALDLARKAGLLGENILGTGFSFDIEIREGAGAFVCGEETALIRSLEGLRGMPTPRPPFPAESGYHGQPTNINNVETLANVPLIILKGPEEYASRGTDNSKGTKIFALAGKVRNTGLVEVPMGSTLRQIVQDIGGGVPKGRTFKAAQTGGPSGGCVPAQHMDMPIDYDSLREIGAIMGSGGLIVMDDQTCMVDIARYFLSFVQAESCGKCSPCRVGTKKMLDILNRICAGQGKEGDVDELDRIGNTILRSGMCGLGLTAPNPVLSTIRFFRDEYDAHIREKRCPACVCEALITGYVVEPETCIGCGSCIKACPVDAIEGKKKEPHTIKPEICIKCGSCFGVCPVGAVLKQSTGLQKEQVAV
ncbi:MAG: NADH-quinone oxidoreductase subunit NuoF [Phycisphaerae bacterium]|nr:NADH-quinone oxidoreductase subunit NuoF [Phycisphaerae bacterium]